MKTQQMISWLLKHGTLTDVPGGAPTTPTVPDPINKPLDSPTVPNTPKSKAVAAPETAPAAFDLHALESSEGAQQIPGSPASGLDKTLA